MSSIDGSSDINGSGKRSPAMSKNMLQWPGPKTRWCFFGFGERLWFWGFQPFFWGLHSHSWLENGGPRNWVDVFPLQNWGISSQRFVRLPEGIYMAMLISPHNWKWMEKMLLRRLPLRIRLYVLRIRDFPEENPFWEYWMFKPINPTNFWGGIWILRDK